MKKLLLIIFFILFSNPAFPAVNFDLIDDVVTCGSNAAILNFNTASTVSAWIYPTVDVVQTGDPRIVTKERLAGDGYNLTMTATKAIYLEVSGGAHHQSVNNTISFNTWQHILVTFDGSTTGANIRIYLNGAEVSYTAAVNGAGGVSNSAATIAIGCRAPDTVRPFGGKMSEVAVWPRVLSANEIAMVYNKGKPFNMRNTNPLPATWWRFNECPDGQTCPSTLFDEMKNNNCTTSNSPKGSAPFYSFSKNSALKSAVMK